VKPLLTVALASLSAWPVLAADPKPGLRAGAFAMVVTPEHFPVSVNGGMTDRTARMANDPLHARCLVLDNGKTTVALAVVDSCMLPRELVEDAKARASAKTGIAASHMLVSATHTHSAPTAAGVFQSDPDKQYVEHLTARIAEGLAKAHANLAPATAGWGVVQEPSQLFNRRWRMKPEAIGPDPFGGTTDRVKMNPGALNPGLNEPAGPVDPDVSVLAVRSATGRPLALLANYSLHYVGDLPPLSADYFGVFAASIGPLIGADDEEPKFVGILSNGTSGDVNNVNVREAPQKMPPGEKSRAVAAVVAAAAKKGYDQAKFRDALTLAVAEKEIELRVRKPSEADLIRARAILAKAGDRALQRLDEVYARESVKLAEYPDTVKVKLQAMRIGDLAIVAIPCEVFSEIGLDIKKRSPLKPTFTIELANGYNGYLPTPAQHELGGYETWRARSSYLQVTASEAITATVLDLLNAVAK
jgi:hypothetical protein